METLLILVLAIALDVAFGEPPNAIHPVFWMGQVASFLLKVRGGRNHATQFIWGVVVVLAIMGVFGVGLIIYAIATANFLFAVIILMLGVIMLLGTFVRPDRTDVMITSTGVVLGDMYYDFDAIQDFSIVYDPPNVKVLYIEFNSPWHPLLSIPLEDEDPNSIREELLPFCVENIDRSQETLTDVLRRVYKM